MFVDTNTEQGTIKFLTKSFANLKNPTSRDSLETVSVRKQVFFCRWQNLEITWGHFGRKYTKIKNIPATPKSRSKNLIVA